MVLWAKLISCDILRGEAERLENMFASIQNRREVVWLPSLLLESHLFPEPCHLVSIRGGDYLA